MRQQASLVPSLVKQCLTIFMANTPFLTAISRPSHHHRRLSCPSGASFQCHQALPTLPATLLSPSWRSKHTSGPAVTDLHFKVNPCYKEWVAAHNSPYFAVIADGCCVCQGRLRTHSLALSGPCVGSPLANPSPSQRKRNSHPSRRGLQLCLSGNVHQGQLSLEREPTTLLSYTLKSHLRRRGGHGP